jgi:hypothetical protein
MSEDNLDFDIHQDLSTYSLKDLQDLLKINEQTSLHYTAQINTPSIPESLKHMYQLSKDYVDSDIADIKAEIASRTSKSDSNETTPVDKK